jgi:hypothetical protein
MRRTNSWKALALLGAVLLVGGCQRNDDLTGVEDPSLNVSRKKVYHQVEFLGNPLVSEVTVGKSQHQAYNFTMPYTSAQFIPVTTQFISGFGRPQALADLIAALLYNNGTGDRLIYYPDRDPATAGWLTWALQPGVGAGGRKLTDDVVDLGLTAIFSNFLNPTGALCQPFQLPLCTDNVNGPAAAPSNTFPYLAAGF